jgi:hypothetical protein
MPEARFSRFDKRAGGLPKSINKDAAMNLR